MIEHIWIETVGVRECRNCGIGGSWKLSVNCEEIVKINETHKWEIQGERWVCSKCKSSGFNKECVPICAEPLLKEWAIKTCNEMMMKRALG